MSEFIINKEMFGRYCKIKTDLRHDLHIYKVVALIESNSYCDVPLLVTSKETLHDEIVPVLLVIHCGIDETKVRKVALKDCEIIPADVAEVKRGYWNKFYDEHAMQTVYQCTACKEEFVLIDGTPEQNLYNYCPNCGARMKGVIQNDRKN